MMKADNKYIFLIWVIVILIIINVTTLLTVLYHKKQSGEEVNIVSSSALSISDTASVQFSGRFFRDQLNLSRDQMDRFTEFNLVFRKQAREINIDLARLRNQMLNEMVADNADLNKLNLLSDSIGFLHADLKKLTYRYYLDIKEISDQDQQKKLEQMFSGIFDSDLYMGQRGRGNPPGRGYGRRFNN
jgi:hypothetical protein